MDIIMNMSINKTKSVKIIKDINKITTRYNYEHKYKH